MCNPVTTRCPDVLLAKGVEDGYEWEVVQNRMAYRCGYVRIPPGHPWHGKGYDDVRAADGDWPDVHGGLTFAEADTDCGKGGEDNAWWLGFDCAHAGDAADPDLPGYDDRFTIGGFHSVVRTTEYVQAECLGLIRQAKEVARGEPEQLLQQWAGGVGVQRERGGAVAAGDHRGEAERGPPAGDGMTADDSRAVIGVRCPTCKVPAGERCRTRTGRVARFHKARPNTQGFTGRDDAGRQFCLTCQRWKYPAIHSCPGVPPPEIAAYLQRQDQRILALFRLPGSFT